MTNYSQFLEKKILSSNHLFIFGAFVDIYIALVRLFSNAYIYNLGVGNGRVGSGCGWPINKTGRAGL